MAIAAMAALTTLTSDVGARQPEAAAPREAGEPIMAIVSIKSQQVTFFDADGSILRAPVSTGTKGRETPAGVFAVLEKDLDHHSTLYDDASMPHMQRLTWNGIAMHGGPLPGYAASHGCVRMPFGFAKMLFDKTRIGMRVIISPDDAIPTEFSHSALPVPNAEAIAAAPTRAETLARETVETAKAADEAKKSAKTAEREASTAKAALRKAERQKSSADADLASAEKAIASAKSDEAKAEERKLKAAAKAAEAGAKLDTAKANADPKIDTANADADPKIDAKAKAEAAKAERQKSSADADLASAEKAIASAKSDGAKAEERRLKAAAKAAEAATILDTIKAEADAKIDAAAKAAEAAKAAAARKRTPPKKRTRQSSRSSRSRSTSAARHRSCTCAGTRTSITPTEARSSIRRSRLPVTIRDPDRPVGTHVFTAMAEGNALALERSHDRRRRRRQGRARPHRHSARRARSRRADRAAAVLDRRLGRAAEPRDQLSHRVCCRAEQPAQGGFITRKPTISVPPASFKPGTAAASSAFLALRAASPPPATTRRRSRTYQAQKGWWE